MPSDIEEPEEKADKKEVPKNETTPKPLNDDDEEWSAVPAFLRRGKKN